MERLELWFVAGTAAGAGEGREQGSRLMRITFIARRAAVLAIVVTALLAPAAAQADILTNWGDSGTVSHDVRGIAVDALGDVYIAEPATSTVNVFTREGAPLRSFGGPGSAAGRFTNISRVAIGPDGDVYVTDATSVQRFSRDGAFKSRFGGWGSAPGKLRYATGVAVAADGTVYVADRWNRRVQAFGADGAFLRVVVSHGHGGPDPYGDDHVSSRHGDHGERGDLDLDDPRGVAIAADGSILVAENEEGFVARVTPGGTVLKTWDAPAAVGVAVAPDGSVLVTDDHANVVRRTTADGAPLGTIGTGFAPAVVPGESLISPTAVATDCRGAVYVTDRSPLRVHVFGDAGLLAPPCVDATPPPPPAAAIDPGPEPQSQVAGISEASPEPTLGASGVGEPVSGRVLVQRPGESRFTELRRRSKLPVGTTVDVSGGVVRVTFATAPEDVETYGPTQSAEFWGGEFRFFQASSGSLVDVILTGDQPDCVIGASASAKAKSKDKTKSRFVWGKGKGKFRTTGNNGAATVRGTYWYTQDRCDGTYFRTREGIVDVSDFGKSSTVRVKAGEKYLARVPCASRRNFDIKLQVPPGQSVADATVRVNGKRVRVRQGSKPKVRVDLRGRPKQRIRVRIDLRLTNGETLSGDREYRTCTPRVSDRTPPRL